MRKAMFVLATALGVVALPLVALAQMKQQRQWRLKVSHVSERPTEWEEPQVKVIAN